jgi:Arc/MetJ-type ribon-helix-helix transcriptional regulator
MTDKDASGFLTITIPAPLGERIQDRIAGTEFASVSDYVSFVLKEVISDEGGDGEEKVSFTKEDEEQVKERLRALGYID